MESGYLHYMYELVIRLKCPKLFQLFDFFFHLTQPRYQGVDRLGDRLNRDYAKLLALDSDL